jgi:formamidopyrimidine-DNA glycosylase
MPEAPEVLEFFNYIKPYLLNKIIIKLNILSGKYTKKYPLNFDKIKDLKILNLSLKGKTIFIECENDIYMSFVHGMTGNWSINKQKHSRFEFILNNDNFVYYNDTRNFGTFTIFINKNDYHKAKNKLGPYILNENLTYNEFYSRLDKNPKIMLGVALLDQNLISGIGNYLRCDILWYTKSVYLCTSISHTRTIGSLSCHEKQCLYLSSINICKFYANLINDLQIKPVYDFFVYQQKYDIFDNKIIKETFKSRTIHFVK